MKNDLFENTDNMTIDSLAQDFPVLTDEEKERIYAMSERKYNNDTDMNTDEKFDRKIEVTGVERYKRPKWRSASIAAAAALVLGAGSFGGYNVVQQFHDGNGEDELPTNVSEEMSQESTGAVDDSSAEEYRSTAESLLNAYEDFTQPYNNDEILERGLTEEERSSMSVEEQDEYLKRNDNPNYSFFWFALEDENATSWAGHDRGIWNYEYFATGMKYSNTDEVMDKALSFMSQSCIDKQFPDLIGDDLTDYEANRIYSVNEAPPHFGTYTMIGGKLYCSSEKYDDIYKIPSTYSFYHLKDEPIEISDITDNSFTACVHYEFTSVPNRYDMKMKIVNDGNKWVIDDIGTTGPELDAQKLEIVDKMLNSMDYYDKISAKEADVYLGNDADIENLILLNKDYADNNALTSYSFNGVDIDYNGAKDIQSLIDFVKSVDLDSQKSDESYCDGEKVYYWNSIDDNNGYNEYDNFAPSKDDPKLSLENSLSVDYYGGITEKETRTMCCPNGKYLVTSYLYDLSKWEITGDTTFEGRDCYVIDYHSSTHMEDRDYKTNITCYVDKETGIPMYQQTIANDDCYVFYKFYYDVHFNEDAEPMPEINIDKNRFTEMYS
ncbi:hypothetical protein [Ruminococcus sp.]|uniref:hypothetical protein n=1 Tax=Ruminococcus sp. TaxID=41978 RepID=UPI0025E6F072|nr:hypothetical protein [Ruminococcus sp.]MBQ6251592.1 hypothetical protein [Ruminococcus sp.]